MSAYSILLTIHSDWRWLVLLSAVFAVAVAAAGLARQLPFTPVARWASLGFIAAMDVQLLLGIVLYFISPIMQVARMDMAAAMKQHDLRFFAVEHVTLMLLAVILAHVGSFRVKRALTDVGRYRNMLGWYIGSLVLILGGMPWFRPLFRL